jgi:hypothetical protein
MPLLVALPLTISLGVAAWQDWHARRLDYGFRILLFVTLLLAAMLHSVWWLAALVLGITLISSLDFVRPEQHRACAYGLMVVALSAGDLTPALLLMGLHWLAYENKWIGGADASLTLGLLALFPTPAFVVSVLVAWMLCCLLGLVAKRWWPTTELARSVPLLVALASATSFYLWLWPLFGKVVVP